MALLPPDPAALDGSWGKVNWSAAHGVLLPVGLPRPPEERTLPRRMFSSAEGQWRRQRLYEPLRRRLRIPRRRASMS
uniref:Uncharacterized protein n=1 Tax=Oryza nivara TaxID=4536 RepID=A0A0E0I1X9_ORYNI